MYARHSTLSCDLASQNGKQHFDDNESKLGISGT